MYPQKHFIFGLIFAIILFFIFPEIGIFNVSLIFLSSFLIDFDHYLEYAYRKKDFSLKRAYQWHVMMDKKFKSLPKNKQKRIFTGFCIFHGAEILIIVLFLGFLIGEYFFFILIGMSFHLLLDILHQLNYNGTTNKLSLIYNLIKFRKFIILR
jgi:hypothetical protein